MSNVAPSGSAGLTFPLQVGPHGHTQTVDPSVAAEQLIAQLLFTNPGERLNRPTLGCGLIELLFDAGTDELRAATRFQVLAGLQQWLSDVVTVVSVEVTGTGGGFDVTVTYRLPATTQLRTVTYQS
jgi:phage baseplate assembly protein W